MKGIKWLHSVLVAILLWSGFPFFAAADEGVFRPVSREEVLNIAEGLVTPGGCPSLTLADCTTSTAFQIRDEIGDMLAQGMAQQEIVDALVRKYGESVLGAPARSGWGLVVWYVPYLLIGLGALFLAGLLYRIWRRKRATPAPPGEAVHEAQNLQEMQEKLKDYL